MYSGYYYGYDPTYILVLVGALLCMLAQWRVQSTYSKFARVLTRSGLTGARAAAMILENNHIRDVRIEHISGNLTDHFDPGKRVVRLSDATYGSASLAAVAVAAHECGHVCQHQTKYIPLAIRTAIVPLANIGSHVGLPLIMIGLLFGMNEKLIQIGIWAFSLAVLFQLVTLPVEFNASRRAITMLKDYGMLSSDELPGAKQVLGAAALTYVAGAASSVMQLLRLMLLFGGNRRRD